MGHFLTSLDTREIPGKPDEHILIADLLFKSAILGDQLITVPTGFISDYASVPRVPVAFEVFGGDIGDDAAAVVHDYLYSTGLVPRETADAVFREALKACGLSAWRAWAMWIGVRFGGESHYTNPTKVSS